VVKKKQAILTHTYCGAFGQHVSYHRSHLQDANTPLPGLKLTQMSTPTPDDTVVDPKTDKAGFVRRSQNGYANTGARTGFTLLPAWAASELGLNSRRGARLETAILARFCAVACRFADGEQNVPVTGLGSVHVADGQFICSALSTARALYVRWFGAAPEGEHFDRFYERVKVSTRRLVKGGWIVHVRATNPNGTGTHGSVWTFDGTRFSKQRFPLLEDGAAQDDNFLNVVDLVGSAFVKENPSEFTQTDVITAIATPRTVQADFMEWAGSIAFRGARGERYMSVGTWRGPRHDNHPVFIPWLVLDMERRSDGETDVEAAYYATQNTLDELAEMGADLEDIIVSSTGGKGYHIRIPSGMLGNPIFQNATESVKVLRAFGKNFISEPVDPAVLNPHQAIRLIGSRRESGLYTRAWCGAEFFEMVGFYESLDACQYFRPFELPDPRTVPSCPDLVWAMIASSDLTRHAALPEPGGAQEYTGHSTGEAVNRALEGCEENEVWYDDGVKIHIGRSKLLFVAACHLLREFSGDTTSAYEALRIVNARCSPPLREAELKGRMKSALNSYHRNSGSSRRRVC
jgi:hypothetical protein